MEKTNLIKRTKRTTNFSIISNDIVRHEKLSFGAKGLLCYILSLPDDWVLHKSYVQNTFKVGKHILRKLFDELEAEGYMHSLSMIHANGRWQGRNYMFYDVPTKNPENKKITDSDLQHTVLQSTEKQSTVNQKLLSTNSNQELKEKNIYKERGASTAPPSVYSFLNGKEIEKKKKVVARKPTQDEVYEQFKTICAPYPEWKEICNDEQQQFFFWYDARDFELSGGKPLTIKNLRSAIVSWMHRVKQRADY